MNPLKPWREIAVPHEDVLKDTFQHAEFAADLSRGHGHTGIQNPALFFQRGLDLVIKSGCSPMFMVI